ncbi:MAG: SRPBCC domain-containing protein [Deltaproteobacteria bacterium]|nr:SRPBCC domain-containing protein [Deltaproteobacteria bacterium]MBI3386251.1 SRPBCC domain-containing protein [Deltaproteobacteria bacterium]
MTAEYQRTFVVAVPVATAWAAFTDTQEREAWMGGRDHMDDPASLETFEPWEMNVTDVEQHRRLSWSQSQSRLDGGYETTVTFEEVSAGTRITIVRSGFGDSEAWHHYAESTAGGWDEMIGDLILYLETGTRGARHFSFRSGLGATTLQSGAGVRITHVVPGGCAAEAGMQPGDLLLWLNRAPVLRVSDVAFFVREHAPGEKIEVEYLRGDEIRRGRAPLSAWNYGSGHYVGHPGAYPKPALAAA